MRWMPNLAIRSQAYWMHLALRALDAAPAPAIGRGERLWLALYLPASFAYRRAGARLALWLGEKSQWLGWLAAFLMSCLWSRPAWMAVRSLIAALPLGVRAGAQRSSRRRPPVSAALMVGVPFPSTLSSFKAWCGLPSRRK